MEEVSNFCPAMAVPTIVKIPEPTTAPMPSAVSDQGPRVFLSRCSGSSESEMSLSMDFLANSWLASFWSLVSFTILLDCCSQRHRDCGKALSHWPLAKSQRPNAKRLLPYRFAVPRVIFFTLRFSEPRGAVRLALGAAFLRAARRAFLRSSFFNFLVLAMNSLWFDFAADERGVERSSFYWRQRLCASRTVNAFA